jgi:hypothetical protein
MLRLAECFILDQAENADLAAETADLTSSREAEELFHTVLWDEGDVTAKVVLVVTSLPLMRRGTV